VPEYETMRRAMFGLQKPTRLPVLTISRVDVSLSWPIH
jgi:hypothetical protein